MIVLNFSHPLTAEHLRQIEEMTHQQVERVIEIPTWVDPQQSLVPQVVALADAAGLSAREWQTLPLLVNPPSLNFIAVALLAELHGRCGHFPAHVRLRPKQGTTPPVYEIAEVLDLQCVRESAKQKMLETLVPRETPTVERKEKNRNTHEY